MRLFLCAILFYTHYAEAKLWSKGIVHYTINNKDFDPHSQEIIVTTFAKLEKEICVKFFNTPVNYTVSNKDRVLYISNRDKRKDCPSVDYDFDKTVVEMPIGYRCLNKVDISRIVLDMLRASVGVTGIYEGILGKGQWSVCTRLPMDVDGNGLKLSQKQSSNDLYRTYRAIQKADTHVDNLLLPADRDFINTRYLQECGESVQKPISARRWYAGKTMELAAENEEYYRDKLWPYGIVMYSIDNSINSSSEIEALEYAMQAIELASCIVFQRIHEREPLQPKNLVHFGREGEEIPHLGFLKGNQTVLLSSMLNGAPGHSAHTLNLLMRILGIPMMSNRYDRTNYILIHWDRIIKTKEHYLERLPKEAWIKDMEGEGAAYDFDSVTHAPANYLCADCSHGEQTVEPLQDYLWQRSLAIGHKTSLSSADIEMLNLLYTRHCQMRFST